MSDGPSQIHSNDRYAAAGVEQMAMVDAHAGSHGYSEAIACLESETALNYPPAEPPLAYSHLAGQEVSTWSEEWKHECEIAYLAGLAPPKLSVMLDGVVGSTDREERGMKGVRGEAAVAVLRAEIARFRQLKSQ
jgi:hypothetical protein